MKLLAIIVCLLMANAAYAYTYNSDNYEGTQASELLEEWYSEVCPYGDAVITDKDKETVDEVSCVNFDYRTNKWVTWKGDVNRKHSFKSFDPKTHRIWVMDGELLLKNGHPEVVFYGVKTIDDPGFTQWIRNH